MDHYACIIQEGQVADQKVDALQLGLQRLGQEFFGDDPTEVRVRWTAIPDNLKLEAGYAHLFKGEFLKRGNPTASGAPDAVVPANDHGDTDYFYTQATLSF